MEFGARLRSLRELRGLTQQQLADRLKAAKSRISRYESGNALPEAETLVTLAEVLEVSIDELLLGRANGAGDDGVQDVRLRERVRELEKVDRKYTEAAIELLQLADAFQQPHVRNRAVVALHVAAEEQFVDRNLQHLRQGDQRFRLG